MSLAAASPSLDHTAELLERLALVEGAAAACTLLLERVAEDTGNSRALAVLWSGGEVITVGLGLASEEVTRLGRALRADAPDSLAALRLYRPSPLGAGSPALTPFVGAPVVPFASPAADLSGALLLEPGTPPDVLERVADLMGHAAPGIGRCWQLETMRAKLHRRSRQYDLVRSIVDALSDPVLLTTADNAIVMSNRRAEHLFAVSEDDNEGRRRAIQINTLLFSSFLTRAVIDRGTGSGGRELNLVDPSDGSDLVFEVLSDPLAAGVAPEGAVLSILRDITDLKRAVAEIEDQVRRSQIAEYQARHERDQLDAMLENVSDPILVTDDHSNIVLLNREADRLFLADNEQGDTEARRAVQANDTRFTTLISDFLLRPDLRRVVKIEVVDPDSGRTMPVEVASSKVLDARGDPRAIVSILHDLTQVEENERLARELRNLNARLEDRVRSATEELEERNRRLEWQSFELERAYRLKSEFLASMSHELRTPINVILGYTSLARERIYGDLTPQQEEALGKIYHTSQHLLELINDILDLSKIEAGKMPVHLERVGVGDIVAELASTVEPMVAKKRLAFVTRVQDGLPPLETDRTKLRQILLNLISNAIKFTHEGTVTLSAEASPQPGRIRMVVADTGIGIRPEHLDVIFEDFRQVDQSRTREYGGTGLGLSITKRLLTLLGGVISVESEVGNGSSFCIELPIRTEPSTLEEQVRRAVVDADRAVVKS